MMLEIGEADLGKKRLLRRKRTRFGVSPQSWAPESFRGAWSNWKRTGGLKLDGRDGIGTWIFFLPCNLSSSGQLLFICQKKKIHHALMSHSASTDWVYFDTHEHGPVFPSRLGETRWLASRMICYADLTYRKNKGIVSQRGQLPSDLKPLIPESFIVQVGGKLRADPTTRSRTPRCRGSYSPPESLSISHKKKFSVLTPRYN